MKNLVLVFVLCFTFFLCTAQKNENVLTAKEKSAGFSLLFNGKDLSGWRSPFKQTAPEKGWEVVDGTIHIKDSAGGGDIVSTKEYKAFELLFDFKITAGANSGVKYFVTEMNDPKGALGLEFQILDDERHPDAKAGTEGNRTMGSLYDLIPSIKPSPANAVGEWNHGKIVALPNNWIQHWINGVKVLEYERGSGIFRVLVAHSKYARIKGFGTGEMGRILLQDHGNSVYYKNIKIREVN